MPPALIFSLIFLAGTGLICYQDFTQRLVSLWLLVLYSLACIASVYFLQGHYALLSNSLMALAYFALIFSVLLLYYFLKEKKFSNPINSRIGLADVVLFVAVGLTFDLVQLVLFFSGVFLISALLGLLWFNRHNKTVPLAGILCAAHTLWFAGWWLL